MSQGVGRREFLKASAAAIAATQISLKAYGQEHAEGVNPHGTPAATADSMILIWIPGGLSHTEYWDPKKYTPYEKGMKGTDMLCPCPSIPTAADGLRVGKGLGNIATVMDRATVVRTVSSDHDFDFNHNRAQFHMITGYPFPAGFKPPGLGAKIARPLGRRDPNMPPFIVIGRDILSIGPEGPENRKFINALHGPGFFGIKHAPFMVKEPEQGIETLSAVAGMNVDRLDRRQDYLRTVSGLSQKELRESGEVQEYMTVVETARAMMDSSIKEAFKFKEQEAPATLERYDVGHRFGWSCLLARRLVERGARYVQVEYPFKTFELFDTHRSGWKGNALVKMHFDRPVAQLISDLDERGLLDRTLVVIMSEFGRTLAKLRKKGDKLAFAAGTDGSVGGFIGEYSDGSDIVIDRLPMYGMHGHFPRCSSAVFFGGGFKGGYVYGKSGDRHPMLPEENPVSIDDLHASILRAMGLAPDLYYVNEGRPIFLTSLGRGRPVDALFA